MLDVHVNDMVVLRIFQGFESLRNAIFSVFLVQIGKEGVHISKINIKKMAQCGGSRELQRKCATRELHL